MIRARRAAQAAFTLTELMITVLVIGLLAAVAIPTFMRNARKAKTPEAVINVKKLYDGSRTYIVEESTKRASSEKSAAQFPESAPLTPAVSCCASAGRKCPPTPALWATPTWVALNFAVDDPHYYRYEYASTGGATPRFSARAHGDLDCDNDLSTFEMVGEYSTATGQVSGSGGLFKDKDNE
jgi:prepilin-type N-terminal cleavage/methylation domain-containing protein